MMTQSVKGKTLAEAEKIFERFHEMVTGHVPASENETELGKLAVFSGVSEFPVRVKCATLAWHTLQRRARRQAGRCFNRVVCQTIRSSCMSEFIQLNRECAAIAIPSGNPSILPAGTGVSVMQFLGQ